MKTIFTKENRDAIKKYNAIKKKVKSSLNKLFDVINDLYQDMNEAKHGHWNLNEDQADTKSKELLDYQSCELCWYEYAKEDWYISGVELKEGKITANIVSPLDTCEVSITFPEKYLKISEIAKAYSKAHKIIEKEQKEQDEKRRIEILTPPKIDLKEKLEKYLADKYFISHMRVYEEVEWFINHSSFNEIYVTCKVEDTLLAVAYKTEEEPNNLKMFFIHLNQKEKNQNGKLNR